jgi:hypothetical protein
MAIGREQTMQEFFKSHDEPFYHYLAWYLVMVLLVDINAIQEILIDDMSWDCYLTFKDGRTLHFTVYLNDEDMGGYSVAYDGPASEWPVWGNNGKS